MIIRSSHLGSRMFRSINRFPCLLHSKDSRSFNPFLTMWSLCVSPLDWRPLSLLFSSSLVAFSQYFLSRRFWTWMAPALKQPWDTKDCHLDLGTGAFLPTHTNHIHSKRSGLGHSSAMHQSFEPRLIDWASTCRIRPNVNRTLIR